MVEDGNGGERDAFLKSKNVKTYLIRPKVEESSSENFNIISSL